MPTKTIAIANDHAGLAYKEILKELLETEGYAVTDFGTNSPESTDYPDYAHPLANAVESGACEMGVLICGSANGVAITANKHQGIRAAITWTDELASLARQHNNANVLCIPARFVSLDTAKSMLHTFLNTSFEGGRHQNRVDKIKLC
jgi:ribose 5-phosphate isomerase B